MFSIKSAILFILNLVLTAHLDYNVEMVLIELAIASALIGFLFYKWATFSYKEFELRGLPFEKPVVLFGNSIDIILGKKSFHGKILEYYNRNKHHKIVGFYNFRDAIYMVHDPEYIKKITVKDFDNFVNHSSFFITDEPLVNDMLSVMKDQRWKHMRNTLTPAFTSSKMRVMFELMTESFSECLQHLSEKSVNNAGFDIEFKDVCNRLSNDLIATTAFGLKTNSFRDDKNEFFQIGLAVALFKGTQMFRFFISNMAPLLFKALRMRIFDGKKTDYFIHLVTHAMKYRVEHDIIRPDMIQLLIEAKQESKEQWTDEEIVAQCFVFFFAAFENNATLICTTAHELMLNPQVQERLYDEVSEVHELLDGKTLSYDVLNKMKYLDQVVSESLRILTVAPSTDRICTKDYTLRDDDDNKIFEFKVGDKIWIPIIGIHRDERYYDNPNSFDPERFSDANKERISPYTYMPFGVGPRICIGNRYALMQVKAMLFHLVLKYRIERAAKSVDDLLDASGGFQITPANGFWFHLVPRAK